VDKDFFWDHVQFEEGVGEILQGLLYDPQTSGGLLISVPEGRAELLLNRLH
jgi:selenide,water dikinase